MIFRSENLPGNYFLPLFVWYFRMEKRGGPLSALISDPPPSLSPYIVNSPYIVDMERK